MEKIRQLLGYILYELNESKEIQQNLYLNKEDAEKIGYETYFAMPSQEDSSRNAFDSGYALGQQDGYIDALQKIQMICEEALNGEGREPR